MVSMRTTRREFLAQSGAAAAAALANELFGLPQSIYAATPPAAPSAALKALVEVALNRAKKLGAGYADIRINRYRDERVSLRSAPEFGSGRVNHVPSIFESHSFGFGVRVIANGAWGFAASHRVNKEEIARVTAEAVEVAKANATARRSPVRLAPVKPATDRWTTPFRQNPFEALISDKLALLQSANENVRKVKGVFMAASGMAFHSEDKFFASTDGSYIQQYILLSYPSLTATARDFDRRISRSRSYVPAPVNGGYEHVLAADFPGNAARVGEEVMEHLAAPPVTTGRKDLVLLPSHLFLTMHESIGHSTELDRALGYEANFAGTSFLTPDKLGKFRVGSELVTIYGDRTIEGGLATCGYDDDGVKTTRFDILRNGVFLHFQTIRDQAHLVGEKESRGCCYADSFDSFPFQRMPNVWLEANPKEMSLEELIAGVEDGILIDGRGSYSIDHQRYNFQFGGDAFWEIKGGKKRGMISRVAYQARTPDFWQACDGLADNRYWQNYGTPGDGKGQPQQTNYVSHGCPPARFRGINVLLTD